MPVYMLAHNHNIASHFMQIAIGAGISEGAVHGGLEYTKIKFGICSLFKHPVPNLHGTMFEDDTRPSLTFNHRPGSDFIVFDSTLVSEGSGSLAKLQPLHQFPHL